MIDFNSLDSEAKKFIESIVDNYVLGKRYMADGLNPYLDTPGVQVQNIFMDPSNKYVFNISLHNDGDSNVEIYYIYDPKQIVKINNEDEYDAEERFIKIKRAEFIYKISLLWWLLDSKCIFLVDDKDWNLFHTGKITEENKNRWTKNGIKYYSEILKSKTLFDFISKFHNCTIIPSPQLIDLRNNKFRTPEAQRFKKSQRLSWTAIGCAILIALGTPYLTNKWSHSTIEQTQFESIINSIQKAADKEKNNEQQMDSIFTVLKQLTKHNGKTTNERR